jgi:hypothetical protein
MREESLDVYFIGALGIILQTNLQCNTVVEEKMKIKIVVDICASEINVKTRTKLGNELKAKKTFMKMILFFFLMRNKIEFFMITSENTGKDKKCS